MPPLHARSDAQFGGVACVRELAASGPSAVSALVSKGVPTLLLTALSKFGPTDPELREQARHALLLLS